MSHEPRQRRSLPIFDVRQKNALVTTPREKASIFLSVAGIGLLFAAIVVATSESRRGKEIYYEYKGAERLDSDMGHAVAKKAVYWFLGGSVVAFGIAYLIRER
jgi:hypothetical protein